MPAEPAPARIDRTEAFEATVAATFGEHRWASGARPSLSDFETLFFPELVDAVRGGWRSATAIDDNGDVRAIGVGPVFGVFPPSRVVFVVAARAGATETIALLGIDFDWSFSWQ